MYIWLRRERLVGCACNDSTTVRHCTKIPFIIISNNNDAADETKSYGHQRYVSTWFFGCLDTTNPLFHRSMNHLSKGYISLRESGVPR